MNRGRLQSGPEPKFTVVVPGVPGYGSHVHTHDHDGSEAPDESPDSILSSEPKPLEKHRWLSLNLTLPDLPIAAQTQEISSLTVTGGGRCRVVVVVVVGDVWRSPVEGGDSEIGGDGDGVVMVRSLSTS
ncbi:hypothetical protein Tco_0222568 [Tanacetum coccineum]